MEEHWKSQSLFLSKKKYITDKKYYKLIFDILHEIPYIPFNLFK
jgi:hypothetical protein